MHGVSTSGRPIEMGDTSFSSYPFLTSDEFYEVVHHFDRIYRQATLGPLRRRWRLTVCIALDTQFSFDGGYNTYLQIIRPVDTDNIDLDISSRLEHLNVSQHARRNADMEEDWTAVTDADDHATLLPARSSSFDHGQVQYEIHLHPTYRVPCLWFRLHQLPATEEAFDIETVFRRLVPDQFKEKLRNVGPLGGISAAPHPVTGVPCFFVHPCLLAEAMADFNCSKENYLMTWIGLVGGCVGLWVPKEMAQAAVV